MKIDVRSKGIRITDDIKDYLEKRLSKLDHFTTRPLEAKVVLKLDAKKARVEITIPLGSLVVRSEESDQEIKDAIDRCAEKLEKQIVDELNAKHEEDAKEERRIQTKTILPQK